MNVVVHPADIQDRDGAFHLLRRARRLFPFIERIFADGGYAGRKMAMTVWRTGAWSLQIVKRSDAAGFQVLLPHVRWISRNRRLARDFERYATTVAAFFRLAMIRIMLRRLAANACRGIGSPEAVHVQWTAAVKHYCTLHLNIHAAAELATTALTAIGQIRSATNQNGMSRRNTPRMITRICVNGLIIATGCSQDGMF